VRVCFALALIGKLSSHKRERRPSKSAFKYPSTSLTQLTFHNPLPKNSSLKSESQRTRYGSPMKHFLITTNIHVDHQTSRMMRWANLACEAKRDYVWTIKQWTATKRETRGCFCQSLRGRLRVRVNIQGYQYRKIDFG
jgi:hypothetical protein